MNDMTKGGGRTDAKPAASLRAAAGAQSRLRMAELLLEVSRRMAAYDTLDEILTALVEVTTEELDAERGTLFMRVSLPSQGMWMRW